MTITMAAEAGQLELNAFEPIIFYCLFQSIDTIAYAVNTFVDNCVIGITANEKMCIRDRLYGAVYLFAIDGRHYFLKQMTGKDDTGLIEDESNMTSCLLYTSRM